MSKPEKKDTGSKVVTPQITVPLGAEVLDPKLRHPVPSAEAKKRARQHPPAPRHDKLRTRKSPRFDKHYMTGRESGAGDSMRAMKKRSGEK